MLVKGPSTEARQPVIHTKGRNELTRIVVVSRGSKLWERIRRIASRTGTMRVVGHAADCKQAVELAEELKPDIMLLGTGLSTIDVPSLTRLLRSKVRPRTRAIRLVSTDTEEDLLLAIRVGCRGLVSEGALAKSFPECVRRVASGETWLDLDSTLALERQMASSRTVKENPRSSRSIRKLTIAEHVMIATLLRRAELAEEMSRNKSRFLADMSHELRTLLNSVIGFSELVLSETAGPINEKQKEFLKDNLSCGRQLRAVINDLLDLAKVEAGKMEVSLETLDPVELLRTEVIDVLGGSAIPKGISLEIVGSVGKVVTDSRKFKNSVYNYVSNAIKFSPRDRRVVVRVERESAEEFSVKVSDEGPGIPPEKMPLLFNRFQQVAASEISVGGTGLGLALTKELTELLGGRVGVDSEFGHGSTFYIVLPVKGPSVKPKSERPYFGAPQPRILVVDDESTERTVLRRALARLGCRVDTASHLREAIKKCGATRYDAITLDLVLGQDDGADLLKEVGPLNQQTPVIVVSMMQRSLGYGRTRVHAQLHKPVAPSVLLESLNSAGVLLTHRGSGNNGTDAGASVELSELATSTRFERPIQC